MRIITLNVNGIRSAARKGFFDWLERQEYAGNEERLRREMLASAPVVLIQRQVGEAVAEGPPALSCPDALAAAPRFAAEALARDALVQEGTYFCVYAPRQ